MASTLLYCCVLTALLILLSPDRALAHSDILQTRFASHKAGSNHALDARANGGAGAFCPQKVQHGKRVS